MRKPEVIVSVSPDNEPVFTNSKLKIGCFRNNQQQTLISFVAQWRRIGQQFEELIRNHDNVSYECSPLDLGCTIQVKVKYTDEGMQTVTKKFGPVKMQPDMVSILEKSPQNELFKVKTLVDNIVVELSFVLTQQQILLKCQDQQFSIKLQTLPYPELIRLDNTVISFRLKTLTDAVCKFMSAILKKPLKYRLDVLNITLESPMIRNYLLFRLFRLIKKKAVSSGFLSPPPSVGKTNVPFSTLDSIRNRKYSDHSVSQGKSKSPIRQNKITKVQLKPVNIEAQLLKDLEAKDLFSQADFNSSQAALNLRDSFVELEQKQNVKSDMKGSFISESEYRQLKGQLEQAQIQLRNLSDELRKVKKENQNIKISPISDTSGNPNDKLMQRIDFLTNENRRLESERAQIIADKLAAQVKFKKQRQQNEQIRRQLQFYKSNRKPDDNNRSFKEENTSIRMGIQMDQQPRTENKVSPLRRNQPTSPISLASIKNKNWS